MKKRLLSLLLVAAMTLSLCACANNQQTENTGTSETQNTGTSETQGTGGGTSEEGNANYLASDKPITAKMYLVTGNTGAFNAEEWTIFKKAAELTNVSFEGVTASSNTDDTSAFNLMMASGELADIIGTSKANIEDAANQGALIDLTDLINKHAPNIKKFFDENPEMRRGATHSDGKIYFIPFAMDGKAATGWYIRKDWLKKLNLEEPKTVDDLYTVLKAFKEQDPNGNGKADEIPFFQRGKVVNDLYPLFGVRLNWHVNKEGKVVYGQYTPEFKTAVENVAKWYKEGLIDQEIFTRSQNARDYALQENIGGCTHDWFTSTAAFNDLLAPKIEGFEFAPIIPPADTNGVSWEPGSRDLTATSGWGISVQCKNPVAMIKYMDFWFTEVGSNLANFGIEGEEWTMVDNKQMFTEKMFQGDQSVVQKLWKIGAQVPSGMGYKQNYWYEQQTLSPIVQEAIRTYIDGGYIIEPFPSIVLTEDEKKIVDKYLPAIQTYIRETEQQWIMGSKDVTTTFDDYMKSLKNMGMDEVVKVYNDAYQRYMSK